MKNLILSAVALVSLTLSLQAQYSINWYKVAGGGGTSTGGPYSLSGTIGQPDAGSMTGGSYGIVGGFWGIIAAVPTVGSPVLTITRTTTNTVLISWPSPSTGFILQQNSVLGSPSWTPAPEVPVDNGTTKSVVINPPIGNRFYRLFK
jgi:hypothetical protein